ncbi:F0F1 ATP synthase subunit gamma [Rubinisphaera italica]|uniref:ATP synthase gamma chain, sodium ion specific n=1 Tax=Rubinisphaera italica TaxID=2527969 RepID=A0A5C5XC08_9PLAN|nr:F0F1 ATP synthase subunit gamma [Rubinisphaera italica]TWT59695.1 ATP synthase gamma chain, sodium ion specific [Rubinisphaera italica]
MSDSLARIRRQITTASDLQSVVRTMKAMAASSIEQYEQSVRALTDYYRTIELGLSACYRKSNMMTLSTPGNQHPESGTICAIVFGSDQGLVGRFNDVVADHAIQTLTKFPGSLEVWAVGERVHARLSDAGLPMQGLFNVPNTVKAIAPLVGQIQLESVSQQSTEEPACVYVFHNRPNSGALYEPVSRRLLPLDTQWQKSLTKVSWPTKIVPEVMGSELSILRALIHEYLFISMFQACAESLASENASRLASMQRADQNINQLLEEFHVSFHRLRQSSIDEELFDVVAGFDALVASKEHVK